MFEKTKILVAVLIIIFLAGTSDAQLVENSLRVSLIKYDPYPVSPDSDFSVWVQIKNVGDLDTSGASIEFVPKYPFSIKSREEGIKYPGTIRKNDEIVYKFSVHVDKNAFVGTNKIEIGYKIDESFTKKEFDIEVGSDIVDARGMVKLEKYYFAPEVLMADDIATVTLTLKNSASEYTIKMDGSDYSMNAQIQSAELSGNDFVEVTSGPYFDVGIIAPGDSIELPYIIRVKNDTPDGIYFLNFNLKGSARLYSLNLKIPVKVDSSSIETAFSETPKFNPSNVVLNVANNRPNTISAATVIPVGNATFEPAEYFIGTMEPDELFTVKFDLKGNNDLHYIKFKLKFKNGANWHESNELTAILNDSNIQQSPSTYNPLNMQTAVILAVPFIMICGLFVVMKRRRTKPGKM